MKILITGGGGYLMSYFSGYFGALSHEFWVTQRSKIFTIKGNIIFCDLVNPKHIDDLKNINLNFDMIIHAAANIDIKFCKGNHLNPVCCADIFSSIYEQNVLSTSNILEVVRYKKIEKMLFLSSQTVYGIPIQDRLVLEITPVNPLEHYALSKVMCEQLIELSTSYMNFQCIILRISGIYGGNRQSGIIYNMLNAAKNRKSLQLEIDYDIPIDILHIDDVCRVLCKILSEECWRERLLIFNCTSGEVTNLKLIIDDIFEITGIKHNLSFEKSLMLKFDNKKIQDFLNVNFNKRRDSLEREWLNIKAN